MILNLLFVMLVLIGLYLYAIQSNIIEGFDGKPRCPDLLIQKDAKFYLYNSKLAKVPGVNPVVFDNLEEYTTFLEWQRKQGIRCPVLYLQSSYDAQGNSVYKVRPSVSEPQAGIPPSNPNSMPNSNINYTPTYTTTSNPTSNPKSNPTSNPDISLDINDYPNPTLLVDSNRNDPPYNTGSYPAHDTSPYYIGMTTPLDMMNYAQEKAPVSPDPMDPNWGGPEYTQNLVDSGYFKNYEVNIYVP